MTPDKINDRLAIAVNLAREAGQLVMTHRRKTGQAGLKVKQKSAQDFVTDMDHRSEHIIRTGLAKAFPSDGFLGEESEGTIRENATWVVDAIDGTTNFVRGFDHWGVSIALVVQNKVVAGVVYNPPSNTVYSAVLNQGAFANQTPLRRLTETDRTRSLASVGFNHAMDIGEHIHLIQTLHSMGCDLRNNGAVAIDLVNIAEGKIDFSFVHILRPWDVLAGLLIATEAGAAGYCPRLPAFLRGSGPVFCGDLSLAVEAKSKLEAIIRSVSETALLNTDDSHYR